MTCRCHAGPLYLGLTECPSCGHSSLDKGDKWEGCERRACAYERTKPSPREDEALQLLHAFARESRHKPAVKPIRPQTGNRYIPTPGETP